MSKLDIHAILYYSYVDSSRMISVQMSGADDDLKSMMRHSGINSALDGVDTGEPNSKSYVQLALFHIKAGRLDPGLYYIEVALMMDPESSVCIDSIFLVFFFVKSFFFLVEGSILRKEIAKKES